ncbi:right-handed parallel beta-helix repeat-containing protein [bacterium]|nr:right-handed parallel beta-helix repeat-containing protein [bacterium]
MKNQHLSFRSSRLTFLCLLIVAVFAVPSKIFASDIYVSVDRNAQADGSLANPYGNIPDAVDAVRALREAGQNEPSKIILREGRHQLNQTLVLGIEDGSPEAVGDVNLPQYGAGDAKAPAFLTFTAHPGETPVISAGMPVEGWERLETEPADLPSEATGKVWVADIPADLQTFYTLYDAQGRLKRARGNGFLPTKAGNKKTLHFPEGALKNWDDLEDVEIQIRPSRAWVVNMLPLASVDESNGVAQTSVSATYAMGALPPYLLKLMGDSAASVWVENTLEVLDEPGEWVVNTKTRKIYLWPSDPGPDGSPRGILAPATTELIRVEGQIDYEGPTDSPVRGIAFEGLTFSHADRWAWRSDENRVGWGMQHDWDMFDRPTALLRFRGAEDCRVTDCKFINSGGSGIRLDLHAQRNRITNCELSHLGEAGILLAGYGPGTKDVNHHNEIVNNYIHHFSEITWHSPGIWAWQSGHNRMVHNELHHSGYSAVLITTRVSPSRNLNSEGGRTVRRQEIEIAKESQVKQGEVKEGQAKGRGGYRKWKRGEKYIHSRHNLFEANEVSHSVQLLSDGNAIYVSGAGTGNIIRNNYLHHNQSHSLPAAIRCDDDQHDTLIYGNVLFKNGGHAAGIASKGVNDIINNFIVDPLVVPRNGYISFEWVPVTGSKVERNIVISHPDGGLAHSETMRKGQTTGGPKLVETEMDKNLYYHPTNSQWMDEHLLKMRAAGKENSSLVGDPLFVDPAGGDFSFQPGSPAINLGIEPKDVSKMGRQR